MAAPKGKVATYRVTGPQPTPEGVYAVGQEDRVLGPIPHPADVLLPLVGIVPQTYGVGGQAGLGKAIPGTGKAFDPMRALQTITDVLDLPKGAVHGAAALGGKAGVGKMAALLGFGVPVRRRTPKLASGYFEETTILPFKMSTPAGKEIESHALINSPTGMPISELGGLGDVAGLVEKTTPSGGTTMVSSTTLGLGREGLQTLLGKLDELLPDREFISFDRAGGVLGQLERKINRPASAAGFDMKAYREGKPLHRSILRNQGTKKRPLTDREKEFLSWRYAYDKAGEEALGGGEAALSAEANAAIARELMNEIPSTRREAADLSKMMERETEDIEAEIAELFKKLGGEE